ncbi:MAG: hypothetical protein V2B17_08105 [Chloroflexota bacterium]
MQPKRSVQPTLRFSGLAPMLVTAIAIVILAVALRASFGGSAGASPSPSAALSAAPGSPPPEATAAPSTPPALLPLPEGLTNRTWVTLSPVEGVGYVAGTLDGSAHLVLPEGEIPLAASNGRVLAVRYGPVAASGLATSSTVILRDVASGKVIVEVERPGAIATAVMGADTAYVAAEYTELPGEVPGVDALSLGDGSVREVIPPQVVAVDPKDQNPWNAVHRGPRLVLSPSGRTLGSCVWLKNVCDIETLDLGTGTLTRAATELAGGLWLLSDAFLVTVDNANTYGYDAATGKLLWTHEGARAESGGYILSDGSTLAQAYQDIAVSERVVATIDLRSGASRELLRVPKTEPAPDLWAEASNDRYAVLIPGGRGFPDALAGTGSFLADLLDLSTGQIERAALRVSIR